MKLERRYELLVQVNDPVKGPAAVQELMYDLYQYQDNQADWMNLLQRAVGFGRWFGPIAVAIAIFVLGRVFG